VRSVQTADSAPEPRPSARAGIARTVILALLGVYAVALALIAFWPQHVDTDAGPLILWIQDRTGLSYETIETGSNVLLFVPMGILLTLLLGRAWIAMLLGIAASATIEIVQTLFLPGRTGSIADVVVNTAGCVIGALMVVLMRRLRAPRRGAIDPHR